MKPRIRIALYGGTRLGDENTRLVEHLSRAFLKDPHVVLVGGGISDPDGVNTSVDLAAFKAATAFANENGFDVKDRLETWLSEIPRPGIHREPWGTACTLHGSPRSRRFQLVQNVHALVTIQGEGETATVLELAMALNHVVLPIGFSGNDSTEFWRADRTFFVDALSLNPSLAERLDQPPRTDDELATLTDDVAIAVLKKAGRRCLVLMDFTNPGHALFLNNVVTPTVEDAGFAVHKLDVQESAGDILDLFVARLHDSHAIVVDLTGLNPNVLYELGRVHQYGAIQPLILVRAGRDTRLPYYVGRNLVQFVGDDAAAASAAIRRYLTDGRRRLRT
jgi:hypothetical protein